MENNKNNQALNQQNKPLSKKLAITFVCIFMAILILPTAVWGAIGIFGRDTQNALNFDTGENRKLAEFPTQFDMQKVTGQIDAWYNDHLPFRSVLYSAQSNMKNWIERAYKNAILPPVAPPTEDDENDGPTQEDFPLIFNNADKKVVYGRGDWLFYGAENSLDYYQGTNLMSEEELAKETASLIKLKELCDERGVELRIFIAPNKERIYSEHMPTLTVNSQRRVDNYVEYIRQNTDIQVVFPIEEILAAKPTAQLYYKYDTHWNEAGAFVGVNALYQSLGMETTNWNTLTSYPYVRNTGDLLNMGDIDQSRYTNDTGYNVSYKNYVFAHSVEGMPLENQVGSQTRIYSSDSPNKTDVFMVGDSFRGSMLPYMQKDFSSITATGRLYLEQSDVIMGILHADVIIVECVERYEFTLSVMADMLIKVLEG